MLRRAASSLARGAGKPPLSGVKVLELEGLAVAPHCAMMLSDFGADVIRVDRKGQEPHFGTTALDRGKRRVELDLKDEADKDTFKDLVSRADVLIEPYRPGVMEHLGLGPDDLCPLNNSLIYTRLTGWGQTGSLAHRAGHDINYIAQSGTLSMLVDGPGRKPVPPVNLLGDFAAGSAHAAFGIVMALFEREKSGEGQVIDAAVTDGAAYLSSFIWSINGIPGAWRDPPGSNLLDGSAPYYGLYETSDGRYMAVGAIEEKFWNELLDRLELDPDTVPAQNDVKSWPKLRGLLENLFSSQTQAHWVKIFEGSDACVCAVLDREQALQSPHNKERGLFRHPARDSEAADSVPMPAPAPRLSRTPPLEHDFVCGHSTAIDIADIDW